MAKLIAWNLISLGGFFAAPGHDISRPLSSGVVIARYATR